MAEVVIALDVASRAAAWSLVDLLPSGANFLKVGLELFVREGPDVVDELRAGGRRVFLDLKLHDIPNTVEAAARSAAEMEAELLTVHAQGGSKMIEAARRAVDGSGTRLIAVTLLTSLPGRSGIGAAGVDRSSEVLGLARQAVDAGAHGVVSSVGEARLLRQALPPDSIIVTPGIRLRGDASDDHVNVATPGEALRAGADILVIGRSVTRATSPADAFATVQAELVEA